jgi:hypothetical protein
MISSCHYKVRIRYGLLYSICLMLNGALGMYLGFLLEMHSNCSLLLFLLLFERPTKAVCLCCQMSKVRVVTHHDPDR